MVRVLIADDEKGTAVPLADMVRACNHEVIGVVGSGLEAIQTFSRLRPDLVLMDYSMPKLNGATACRNILAKYRGARVVLLTGPRGECSIDSGALSILSKPLSFDQVRVTLDGISKEVIQSQEIPVLPSYFWNPVDRQVA